MSAAFMFLPSKPEITKNIDICPNEITGLKRKICWTLVTIWVAKSRLWFYLAFLFFLCRFLSFRSQKTQHFRAGMNSVFIFYTKNSKLCEIFPLPPDEIFLNTHSWPNLFWSWFNLYRTKRNIKNCFVDFTFLLSYFYLNFYYSS